MAQNGLILVKQDNVPAPGDTISVTAEQANGQSGRTYTRFRRNTAEYGGTPHRVEKAELTGRSDNHGNVWVSVDLSPIEGAGAAGSGQQSRAGAAPASSNQREENIAQAGAFNAGLAIAVAEVQAGAYSTGQLVDRVKHWHGELIGFRRAIVGLQQAEPQPQPEPAQQQIQQEQPPAQTETAQPATADDDIPF